MEDPRPISERLHALGFGHRPSRVAGKRVVFNLETGRVLGTFEGLEALEAAQAEVKALAHEALAELAATLAGPRSHGEII